MAKESKDTTTRATDVPKKANRFLDPVMQPIFGAFRFEPANMKPYNLTDSRDPGVQYTLANVMIDHGVTGAAIFGAHVVYRRFARRRELSVVWPTVKTGGGVRHGVIDCTKDDKAKADLAAVSEVIIAQYEAWQEDRKALGLTAPLDAITAGAIPADDDVLKRLGLMDGISAADDAAMKAEAAKKAATTTPTA